MSYRGVSLVDRFLKGLVGGVIPILFVSPWVIMNSQERPIEVLHTCGALYVIGFVYFFVSPD